MLGLDFSPRIRQLAIAIGVISVAAGIGVQWLELPVLEWLALSPRALVGASPTLPGIPALWQLVSYPWVAFGAFEVIFAVLTLGWFGSDLERAWGDGLFLDRLALLWLGSTAGALLLALVHAPLRDATWLGPSAVFDGLLVAWGFTFPTRNIRIFFVLPVPGRAIAWLVIAITALTPVFGGPDSLASVAPHLFAVAIGYGYGHGPLSLRRIWLRVQERRVRRALERERKSRLH
jgi:membrane associated rhomboid family serine protease